MGELQAELRQASQIRDQDAKERIKTLIGEEKSLLPRNTADKEIQKDLKLRNKERAKKGLEPVFIKKRELKEMRLQKRFDQM